MKGRWTNHGSIRTLLSGDSQSPIQFNAVLTKSEAIWLWNARSGRVYFSGPSKMQVEFLGDDGRPVPFAQAGLGDPYNYPLGQGNREDMNFAALAQSATDERLILAKSLAQKARADGR